MSGFSIFPSQPTNRDSEPTYSVGHIRRRIEALKLRFEPELAFAGRRRMSREFCEEWDEAVSPW